MQLQRKHIVRIQGLSGGNVCPSLFQDYANLKNEICLWHFCMGYLLQHWDKSRTQSQTWKKHMSSLLDTCSSHAILLSIFLFDTIADLQRALYVFRSPKLYNFALCILAGSITWETHVANPQLLSLDNSLYTLYIAPSSALVYVMDGKEIGDHTNR